MCGGASPKDKMEQEGGEATPEGTIEGRQSHPRRGVAAPKDAIESGAARPPQKGKYMGGGARPPQKAPKNDSPRGLEDPNYESLYVLKYSSKDREKTGSDRLITWLGTGQGLGLVRPRRIEVSRRKLQVAL